MVLCFHLKNINRAFVPNTKHLNMFDGPLFVLCLLINRLVLLFSCISRTYLVAVYALNTPKTRYCFFLTTENVPFIFDAMIWTSKHQPHHFSILETSKYVRWYLVSYFLVRKYVLCTVLLHFNLSIHQPYWSCCSSHSRKCSINLWCCALALKTSSVPLLELRNL